MTDVENLISAIESQWEEVAAKTIAQIMAAFPDDQFYAAGFWLFYCDYTVIHPPCFGANTEASLAESGEDAKYHRWTPPNWRFDTIGGLSDKMMPLYEPLCEEHEDDVWQKIMEDHKQSIARVCRRVTQQARSGAGPFAEVAVPANFVVGIFEEQDGDEEYDRLAIMSIEKSVLADLDVPIG